MSKSICKNEDLSYTAETLVHDLCIDDNNDKNSFFTLGKESKSIKSLLSIPYRVF